MKNRSIIFTFILLMLASFIFLAYSEQKQHSFLNANFWSLAFANPKSTDLNFVIENNTDQTNFQWQVLAENNIIKTGNIVVNKGNIQEISLPKSDFGNLTTNKKITIEVTSAGQKKDIYKIF
jgi:hypothetical protein